MKIVIVGGGPAALESAFSARKNAPDAEIDIFSAENHLPYRRPALSGLLAAGKEIDKKTFFIKNEEFFNAEKITFHPGCRAVKISGKELFFESGEKVIFDRLIIASGSNAVSLPIPGAEKGDIFTLRSLDDMLLLKTKLESGIKSAVIIGGGVLGLEIADSLLTRNIQTTVLEAAERLFQNNLSENDSAALKERLNNINGLKIKCGVMTEKISGKEIFLNNGEKITAEIIICAVGCCPDVTLAESAGIKCGRGIITDDRMRSSREDIFAAGDAAQFNGKCFNLYMDAVASGKIAGINASGGDVHFSAKPSPVRFFALGEKLIM